jgi:hypothetical protein
MRRLAIAALLLVAFSSIRGGATHAQGSTTPTVSGPSYDVRFEIRVVPSEKLAHVAIHLADPARAVDWLRFRVDPERQLAFRGDGKVEVKADGATEIATWTPPRGGGALRYVARIDHLRDESSYDARATRDWALVRADDLVPPVHARFADGAQSRARLQLVLPRAGPPWCLRRSTVPERRSPERRFDRRRLAADGKPCASAWPACASRSARPSDSACGARTCSRCCAGRCRCCARSRRCPSGSSWSALAIRCGAVASRRRTACICTPTCP